MEKRRATTTEINGKKIAEMKAKRITRSKCSEIDQHTEATSQHQQCARKGIESQK
jgi:hypothetical protein